MNGDRAQHEIHQLAAAYALGALNEAERRAFETHLEAGCGQCQSELERLNQLVGELGLAAPPVQPPAHLRDRLMQRIEQRQTKSWRSSGRQIWKEWKASPPTPTGRWEVRANEGRWLETGYPGVFAKNLFVDEKRQAVTMLIQMAPGARYPAHRHDDTEICYVIQGDVHFGERAYQAGDYIHNMPDSIDEEVWTTNGCLLFIISSQNDQLLDGLSS
ncbi:MAG: cupin domain-containing protein [Acidobacteriota bacterium]|nr:cupin domain-containing protein [Blastocatellia bacterium]MDW8241162.1 cupin domain-containing protein [Acidobacteriota bacterium]